MNHAIPAYISLYGLGAYGKSLLESLTATEREMLSVYHIHNINSNTLKTDNSAGLFFITNLTGNSEDVTELEKIHFPEPNPCRRAPKIAVVSVPKIKPLKLNEDNHLFLKKLHKFCGSIIFVADDAGSTGQPLMIEFLCAFLGGLEKSLMLSSDWGDLENALARLGFGFVYSVKLQSPESLQKEITVLNKEINSNNEEGCVALALRASGDCNIADIETVLKPVASNALTHIVFLEDNLAGSHLMEGTILAWDITTPIEDIVNRLQCNYL